VGNLLTPSSVLENDMGMYLPKYMASHSRKITLKPQLEPRIPVLGLTVRRSPSIKCVTYCKDTKLCSVPRGLFTVNVPFVSRGKQ
jgi:hypothetical protein